MSGIYDVNEAALLDAVRKIQMAQVLHDRVVELVKVVEERVNILDATSRNAITDVKTICEDEVKKAKYELSIIDEKLRAAYDACVAEQKQVVLYEKKKLVEETFAEAEERLSALKQAAERTINTVRLEMPEGALQVEPAVVQSSGGTRGADSTISDVVMTSAGQSVSAYSSTVQSASADYSNRIPTAVTYLNQQGGTAKENESPIKAEEMETEIPDVNLLVPVQLLV